MDFYQGRVLKVDLSAGTTTVEPLNMEWAQLYVGGKGLMLRYLWDLTTPGMDPWSPDNPLIVATGPFAGTNVSTASRVVLGGKSPASGTILDSYCGGSFGSVLKFAGYDMIIVTGCAAELSMIWIRDDEVSIVPAGSYAGMKTSALEAALRTDFDAHETSLSIGPAGESKLPWACVSNDQYHKAGRGGTGALMGSKNLKAIAVVGTGKVTVGDALAFLVDIERMDSEYILTDANYWVHEEGTPILVSLTDGGGCQPTRNYSEGTFEGAEGINSEAFQKIRLKKRACYQCTLACRNFHHLDDVEGEGPEYETIALCGSNCGVGDIGALMKFNESCDEFGLDTISTGNVLGLAMDMTEKGIHDFGVHFGELDTYLKVPEQIATRTGIGADLALGSKALAAKYGCPELAMQVKGLEAPGYDPRGSFGMSIAYATSDRGACHMRSFPVGVEVVEGSMPADTLDESKAKFNVDFQNHYAFKFCGIWCDFWAIDYDQMTQLMRHLWRREVTPEELEIVGERVWNLSHLFNLREGFTAKDDTLPQAMLETPFTKGVSAGRRIGTERFHTAMNDYYRLRGWDENGVPSEEKLQQLGVDVRL
ncbi:MAG: aldehyde ferredoxin oxidoreductase family protein [Thermoleophilia bacterium]